MSVQVPKGYKQTEVGVIPEDWSVTSVEELVEFEILDKPMDGNHGELHPKKSDFVNFGIPFIMANDVVNGKIDFNKCVYITGSQAKKLRKGFSKKGDVLLTHKATIGNSAVVKEDEFEYFMLTPQVTYYRVLKKDRLNNLYLKNYFDGQCFQDILKNTSGGGTRAYIGITAQLKLPIVLPSSFAEQQAIAEALSDADALIESLEQLIAKKRQIKQGAMQELLTGQRRLPGFSGEWKNISFNEALFRIKAKKYQINTSDYNDSGIYPVVDQSQIDIVGYSDNKEKLLNAPQDGLIVFGDHTCVVKYVDFDFLVGADGTQILCANDGGFTKFYYWLLNFDGVKPTGYNRHYKFLQDKIFQVPDFYEQEEIANQLFAIEHEINALRRSVGKYKKIKQSMMQELLTGRIRLI